jgi:hypothetical protein
MAEKLAFEYYFLKTIKVGKQYIIKQYKLKMTYNIYGRNFGSVPRIKKY